MKAYRLARLATAALALVAIAYRLAPAIGTTAALVAAGATAAGILILTRPEGAPQP